MKKTRLLTISPTCEVGGADINLLRLFSMLNKEEYEIVHLIPYRGALAEQFVQAGAEVIVVDMPRIRLFRNPLRYLRFCIKFFPTVGKIRRIIESRDIDIVMTSSMVNLYGALAAWRAHRAHILMANECLWLLRLIVPYFYLLSDRIICASEMVEKMFMPSRKVVVMYPCVVFNKDVVSDSEAQQVRRELGVTGGLVSMVTRLARWKGVEVFINSAQFLKGDVTCLIAGVTVLEREHYLDRLHKLIASLHLQKRVLMLTNGEFRSPAVIAASDIVVHASLRAEPFGLIIAEAMAQGKPVIASNRGGPREIITDGRDGVLVAPNDPRALAARIDELLIRPDHAREIGLCARKTAQEKFDARYYAIRFNALVASVFKEYAIRKN